MAAPVTQSYGPGNVDELLTTSLVNMIPGIRDNVFKSNPVFKWLYEGKNGGKMRKKGGVALSHAEMYAKNTTALAYQRYDLLDTTPQDGLTRDQWLWAQYAATITIDGFSERVANAGDSKLEDLLEAKKMQAEESLALLLEQDMFAASAVSKHIEPLTTIVATSGTVGSINGTTNTWWQACAATASGSFAAQGRSDLTNAWNLVSVQNPIGGPEMLVSDQSSFQYYESSLVPQERFTDNKMVDIGIENLKFKATPWTWSPQATSGVIYLLHSKGIEFIVNSDTDFLTTEFVTPTNQDARTAKILLACALTSGNRRKNAKLTGLSA
jgi:hypothetical protein